MEDDVLAELAGLSPDEQFRILPHRKIMRKEGPAGRRMKKYYKDRYAKSGVIPKPLLPAAKGILEGRRCSGRSPALDDEVKRRFAEMAEASADPSDERFMFVSRKCGTIENYRCWLEEEFGRRLSIHALRRYARAGGLKRRLERRLEKPDFGKERTVRHSFKSVPVFGLVQMDGCKARYIRIRDPDGRWEKPLLIEIYDTASRYMFGLDAFFSESSESALRRFCEFLLSVEFPRDTVRFRPDGAGGFARHAATVDDHPKVRRNADGDTFAHARPERKQVQMIGIQMRGHHFRAGSRCRYRRGLGGSMNGKSGSVYGVSGCTRMRNSPSGT